MPDISASAIALPFSERTAAVTVTITLGELARRIGQADDGEAAAALADGLRRWPARAGRDAQGPRLAVPLADGDPAVTLEGTARNLAFRLGIAVSSQLHGSGAPAELAALIDAAATAAELHSNE